ncbi:hypothetical protein KJ570_01135 [Patescibacteria group bacterium]|nr:hypothetical protein [Patescibacteria group bacterium]MBU2036068.1 hypothetical protein [Patescibacteria group bacterium]
MARLIFPNGQQTKWIESIQKKSGFSIEKIASICKVSIRTIRDWKREKYSISHTSIFKLINNTKIKIPKNAKVVDDFWYVINGARKGGLKRTQIYGPPGNYEGRIKGGKISQLRRKNDPEKYRKLGCKIKKTFPDLKPSSELAELVGIILGDGGITNNQLKITLGLKADYKYALFVTNLLEKIIGEKPSWNEYNGNVILLCISGVNLVQKLEDIGVYKGNKIQRQIDVPSWIWNDIKYQKFCVKGLMDTDGGIYFHEHWIKGVRYKNMGLCFTSHSKPLLTSVSTILNTLNIKNSIQGKHVYIYKLGEILKYFKSIGTHNPKHEERLNFYLKNSNNKLK